LLSESLFVPVVEQSFVLVSYESHFLGIEAGLTFALHPRSSQIVGAIVTGFFLDSKLKRKLRAWVGLAWLAVLVVRASFNPISYRHVLICLFQFSVFGGNYAFQRSYTRESVASPDFVPLNIKTGKYAGVAILYVFNGILDAAWQTYACA
jgi:hypothetical protein